MRLALTLVGIAVAILIGTWLVTRRRSNMLGSAVSERWRSQQEYDRSGDES